MRKTVLLIGAMLAALSTTAFAGGKRHITLHINNQTAYDFTNGNAKHKQVHVDTVQTTVKKGRTGLVKFHFDEDSFSDVMMNVTYLVATGNGEEVELKYHIDTSGSACKIVTPPDLEGNYNDCHDIDVHYDFANK
ncbi:hypothetical protein [Roseibium sp. MMSF_3412]|uniref:hypothetical protein n=1 Tax=Roseibium sp. MMSF_3412 TaxID=3046712 RepID=UPI00273FFCFA|nr:hypothetical protein [Roseibium sp. MMSF_3412]